MLDDVNFWILIVMIGSIIVSGLLSRKSIMQTRDSIEQNNKIQSALISLQLLEKLREPEFREINEKIASNTITDTHIINMYGSILTNIKENEILERFFAKDMELDSSRYKNLKDIIKKHI